MGRGIVYPKLNVNVSEIKRLLENYSIKVFTNGIKSLIYNDYLNNEEKRIVLSILKYPKHKRILNKSYLMYISYGILKFKDKVEDLKNQLMLDISILALKEGIIKEFNFNYPNQKMFSSVLNQQINCSFDKITRKGESFIFHEGKKIVLVIKETKKFKITDRVMLLKQNRNPFHNYLEPDHPDVDFLGYDLGNKSYQVWINQLNNAYSIIRKNVPHTYQEIVYFLDSIVPVGYKHNLQISFTYSSSPLITYLSYTNDDIKQAEALIHEIHHIIYNLLSRYYFLTKNSSIPKYYSPYRPDARPLNSCLVGLHAFVAVQNFYRALCKEENNIEFVMRFLDAYIKNKRMIEIVDKYAKFDNKGKLLFEDINVKFFNDNAVFNIVSKMHPTILNKVKEKFENHFNLAKKTNKMLLY